MEVFTLYDLYSLNGSKVAEGHKASFCLEDSECDEGDTHTRTGVLVPAAAGRVNARSPSVRRYREKVRVCQLRGAGHHGGLLGHLQARHRLPVGGHHRAQTGRLHLPGEPRRASPRPSAAHSSAVPVLQIVINPNYEVPETDYSNNVVRCRCRYDGHRVWMYSCHNGNAAQPLLATALRVSADPQFCSHPGGSLSTETEQTFPGLLSNQVTHR